MPARTLDWYEDELEREDLSPELRKEYEEQADRLAGLITKSAAKAKARILKEQERLEDIKQRLKSGDESVIDIVGIPEFGQDYELKFEDPNHVVYSHVALEAQQDRHVHPTLNEARSHYRKLIWDRLYTKYVRSGELDSLKQME